MSYGHFSSSFILYFCLRVVYKALYYEDPLMDFIHIWPDGRYRA